MSFKVVARFNEKEREREKKREERKRPERIRRFDHRRENCRTPHGALAVIAFTGRFHRPL